MAEEDSGLCLNHDPGSALSLHPAVESEEAAFRPGGNLSPLRESEPDYFGLTL